MSAGSSKAQFSLSEELNPLKHPRRFLFLLAMIVFARGLALMCILPPLEGWDEYQHLAFIDYLQENGRPPVSGQDYVAQPLLDEFAKWPQSSWGVDQLGKAQATTYADFWARDGHTSAVVPDAKVPLYEAQQTSLYYRLVERVYTRTGGAKRLLSTVGVLRLVNLAFLVGATVLFADAVRTLCPEPWVQVPVLVALALNPMLLLTSVRVANDALALLSAAAVLWLGVWIWSRPPAIQTVRNYIGASILLGLLTGVAVLCKATNLALLPFAACCAWVGGQGHAWHRRLSGSFWTLFASGLALLEYVRSSLIMYGVPIPALEAILNHRAGRGIKEYLAAAASIPWPRYLSGWWISHNLWVGGWSTLGAPRSLQNIYLVVMWTSLAGWLFWSWRSWMRPRELGWGRSPSPTVPLLLLASFSASLAAYTISSQLAWGMVQTEPWYAAPAIPMLLLVAVGGIRLYPWQRVARLLCVALPVVYLLTEGSGLYFIMPRAYTMARGAEAMHRLALLHPSWLGTRTFFMASGFVVIIAAFIALESWPYFWNLNPDWRS